MSRSTGSAFPGHEFPPDLAEAIHARTGGNPLFVAELVRFLRDREVIALRDDRWGLVRPVPEASAEMPESIRGLIRRKLDQLEPADRGLLAAAAAQSGEFDSAVVARASGEEAAVVEERLQEIERVHGLIRLVREHEFPDRTVSRRYVFVHAVYQDALSAGLAPARRAAVCRASADALIALQNGQPGLVAAELALLYEAGREFGRAADLFHAAAQNAARVFAHRESAILARRGLGLLRGLPESPDHAGREFRLLMTLALQLQITDGFAAADVEEAYFASPGGVGTDACGRPALSDPLGTVARLQGPLGPRPGAPSRRGVARSGRTVGRPALVLLARQAGDDRGTVCGRPGIRPRPRGGRRAHFTTPTATAI